MAFDIENWVYATYDDVLPYRGTDLRVNCPFCEERGYGIDTSFHLYISIVKEACHCFRCDYGYQNWASLVSDVEGMPFGIVKCRQAESVTPLYKLMRRQVSLADKPGHPLIDMPDGFLVIADGTSNKHQLTVALLAKEYVRRRLSKYVDNWEVYLHVFGVWDTGFDTIVLPIERGWYQERHMRKYYTGPKYLSTAHDREDRLYNYTALDLYDQVHIAEGVFSAACIGDDSIALCSKTANDMQVRRMCRSRVDMFVVCLDAGFTREALKLAEQLYVGGKAVRIRQYESGDPASCTQYTECEYNFASRVALNLGL